MLVGAHSQQAHLLLPSMSPRKFTPAIPFPLSLLPVQEKKKDFLHVDIGMTEKDFDPAALLDSPSSALGRKQSATYTPHALSRVRGCASNFLGWPTAVILGQVFIQCLGWGFLIAVKAHGDIPLSFGLAHWVKNNGHLVTLLATLIATMLSGTTSFLFSYAIRRSMSLYLYRPVSLGTLGASVSISMRSVVFHRRSWKWPTVSLVFFFLTGVQTSGWSTLLTPVTIVVSTPLVGSDVDLSSPILGQMYDPLNDSVLDYCVWDETDSKSLYTVQTESGYAAARATLGKPSTFTLMNQVFNVSTGGILPAYLSTIDYGAWFTNGSFIPPTTHNVSRLPPRGFSTNYSMVQQGFTADVSCSFRNLTGHTTPSLRYETTHVKDWTKKLGIRRNIGIMTYSEIDTDCPDSRSKYAMNWTGAFTMAERHYIMMIACQPDTADNYTVILSSHGDYKWLPTTVCQIAPKITTVQVDYSSGINITVDSSSGWIKDPDGLTGLSAIQNLVSMVYQAQGILNNVVGDHLTTIKAESKWNNDNILKPLEAYLQGVVEYTGSVFRGCLAANASLHRTLEDISIPTKGTFRTETMGWTYVSGTTHWVLIPGTLIALSTIVIVGVALYRHVGDIPQESNQFDPSDPLHLMAAAAAGGLNNTFNGLSQKDMKEGEKLEVLLGSISGRGPALVRADRYRPVFSDAFSPRSAYDDGAD
ncbi:hypothetical protein B0H13DRAFT_2670784 [Mycena leptocephala]|nr:hypothetical protein B0H13DRAFT_2670784 [Mycena leptocephala]